MSAIEVPVAANAGQQIELTEMSENVGHRDPLYLFLCHLEWHTGGNLGVYQELLAALDDNDYSIRMVAEVLLHRSSPRREPTELSVEAWWCSGPSFRNGKRLASEMRFYMYVRNGKSGIGRRDLC